MRETSIDLHVPELTGLLAPWRDATVDVASKGVPPHVTLLYPWLPAPIVEADLDLLRSALAQCPPITLRFHELRRFEPGVLYLALQDEGTVRRLMQRIQTAFPALSPYGGSVADPTPHLTVAKASDARQLAELHAQADRVLSPCLPLEYARHQIVVMQEDERGHWDVRGEIALD